MEPARTHSSAFTGGVEFETPENVRIRYPVAGPGTRFLAWLLDWMLAFVLSMALGILLLIIMAAAGTLEQLTHGVDGADIERNAPQFAMYFVGILWIVMAFGSFAYFFLQELLFRGQTVGKRILNLRVVKADGFSLDALSILTRNLFRFVDHLPPLWAIPILSQRTQRPGDMAAGTLVVSEAAVELSPVRAQLARRDPLTATYQFNAAQCARLRPVDLQFIEQLLDRWNDLPRDQLRVLLTRTLPPLSQRLKVERPPASEQLRFLEDLLTAEYQQRRRIG
ncbi:MAG: RDD family protein [Planctomycetaceae bacterium]